MPSTPTFSTVRISALIDSFRTYAVKRLDQADRNRDGIITRAESGRLPADLRDNFASSQFANADGSVDVSAFLRELNVTFKAFVTDSDRDDDDQLSEQERELLPRNFRDNVENYLRNSARGAVVVGEFSIRNETTPQVVAAHERAFGPSAISYEDAAKRALEAVATDPYGLRYFVEEVLLDELDEAPTEEDITRRVKTLLQDGTMYLVDVDEEIPTGESNEENWIFSFATEGQGDQGLWAVVNRDSGETVVVSFN